MVKFCAVYDCSNRSNREKTKSYYRIPQIVTKQGKEALKLSTERRRKWMNAIFNKHAEKIWMRNHVNFTIEFARITSTQVSFLDKM